MERDRQSLLEEVRAAPGAPPVEDSKALVKAARSKAPVAEAVAALARFLPATQDEELNDYCQLALLGVCVGFADRHLSPFVEEHLAIIPPLLDDIRTVYHQLKEMGEPFDDNEFRFRAYDYGIHKAYYLDWRLYLSHEMY